MKKRFPALLAVALLAGACARGEATPQPGKKPDRTSPVAAKQTEEPPVLSHDCQSLLGDFLDALTELDSLVTSGLAFEAYSQRVGDIRVTYERIETSSVGSDCLTSVQLPAERALNRYVEAYNIWNNCVGDGACTEADVMSKLEAKWAEATSNIDAAETGLETLPRG